MRTMKITLIGMPLLFRIVFKNTEFKKFCHAFFIS